MGTTQPRREGQRIALAILVVAWAVGVITVGCARLPYTTQTVHEDEQVVVTVQQEAKPRSYTHPVQITSGEIASILRGFSVRPQQRLPLRWFAEEAPPKPLFREDEIQLLAPHLAAAMQQAGTKERAHFEVRMPKLPRYDRDTTEGWVAIRDPYAYLTVEQFHSPITIRKSDLYDRNYPTAPPPPRDYILYFEPGRFWTEDDKGVRALEFRQFLKSGEAGGAGAPRVPPAVAP